jgi:hypothetical protein
MGEDKRNIDAPRDTETIKLAFGKANVNRKTPVVECLRRSYDNSMEPRF